MVQHHQMNAQVSIMFLVNLSLACQKQSHSCSFRKAWEGGILFEDNNMETWPIRFMHDEDRTVRNKGRFFQRQTVLVTQRYQRPLQNRVRPSSFQCFDHDVGGLPSVCVFSLLFAMILSIFSQLPAFSYSLTLPHGLVRSF